MTISDFELKLENQWLQTVLQEAHKQLNSEQELQEKFKKDALETQKELWEEIGSVSIANGLDQIVDFFGFIDLMKRQKRSHEITKKIKEKYEKMILSPYFGRIDYVENGEEKADKYYIGISNLINDDYDLLIYDWRAPVSSMFYDYEIGNAKYECPEGVIEGELTLKRQYKIANSKLEYMFDSNLKIDDEILQNILSKSTDSKMNAIVTTIQREQNKVIRNEEYKNIIVQGPAGSGKTSIALHRIAYLLYKHRDEITPENIVIFSPNEVFNDYISNVLPQLGEDNMYQTTFKEYMHKALGSKLNKEDYCDMMEYILAAKEKPNYAIRIKNIKYKSSNEFIDILKKYVNYIERENRNFSDIVLGEKLVISATELEKLFYEDYVQLPLKRRLEKIKGRVQFLLKPYEKDRIREVISELESTDSYLNEREITEKSIATVRKEMKGIYNEINRVTEFDIVDIYIKLFKNIELFIDDSKADIYENDLEEIKTYTIENLRAKKLNYEDQPPLLFLKGALGDIPKTSEIKYIIIDEAQDYTPLQYEIFYQLFNHASITMLGDLNQSINPFMNVGDYNNISKIFPKNNTCVMNLTKSYRSTIEITEFSRKVLNKEVIEGCVERNGHKPIVEGFEKEEEIKERILEDINKYKKEGYKSVGIITRTKKETDEVYTYLKDEEEVKSIVKEDDEYTSGVVVIPAYLAKGLEFDVVIIYNAGDGNYNCEEERILLYTACTRALHMLCVYYSGKITPLIG